MNSIFYNQLTIFHAIAEEGSISAAARRLGMAAPSVSKSLKLLEENLATPLFFRTTRRISLTEEGKRLRENTIQAVQTLENAVAEVRGAGGSLAGSVRITLSRFAFYLVLQPLYAEFCRCYPEIELEISLFDGIVDIVEQGFDMGIRFHDRVDEGMVARRLLPSFKNGLYASASYADSYGIPQTPADLARHKLIGYRFISSNRMLPLILNDNGKEVAVEMPLAMISNDIDVMADAVRQGIGIGRIFEPHCRLLPDAADFIPVLPDYWQDYPAVSLYYLQNSRKSARVQAVADFFVEKLDALDRRDINYK